MSGYRTWHRQLIFAADKNKEEEGSSVSSSSSSLSKSIWHVKTSPLFVTGIRKGAAGAGAASNDWRIWTVGSDGLVRSYHIHEKSMEEKQDTLDASAVNIQLTHSLRGKLQHNDNNLSANVLGCTQLSWIRNYTGQDTNAGDCIMASLELSGKVRVWIVPETMDNNNSSSTKERTISTKTEFLVENATGTILQFEEPRSRTNDRDPNIAVWVALLDGTLVRVATGLSVVTPSSKIEGEGNNKKSHEPSPAGTILDRYGTSGSSIILSMAFHPKARTMVASSNYNYNNNNYQQSKPIIAVGRQDGCVDILPTKHKLYHAIHEDSNSSGGTNSSSSLSSSSVRALSYTPDGNLLIVGNDIGRIYIYDVNRNTTPNTGSNGGTPVLVNHVQAHPMTCWITNIVSLLDSRRFISTSTDGKIHVWDLEQQLYQPTHTFENSHMINNESDNNTNNSSVWTTIDVFHDNNNNGNNIVTKEYSSSSSRLISITETGFLQLYTLP